MRKSAKPKTAWKQDIKAKGKHKERLMLIQPGRLQEDVCLAEIMSCHQTDGYIVITYNNNFRFTQWCQTIKEAKKAIHQQFRIENIEEVKVVQ